MADALCGPANPLSSFQKHTQVDRTLQQDRLAGPRHSPAQGFRTLDPRTGSLDAEFAAFEAGPSNPFQSEQLFRNQPFQAPPTPAISNWAADFQKLQVSNQPLPAHQFRTEAPLVRSGIGGWQNEFLRQRQSGGSQVSQGKQTERSMQMNAPSWTGQQGGYLDHMGPSMYQYQPTQMPFQDPIHDTLQPQYLNGEGMQLSEADFEHAFSEAFQEAQHMDTTDKSIEDAAEADAQRFFAEEKLLHSDGTYTNDHSSEQDMMKHNEPTELMKIGSDAISYTEQKDRTADQDTRDADELARTAGQLLSSVQHDSSSKFKGSQFLALMRRIRDREVEVQGEEFQATDIKTKLTPHQPNDFTFPDLNEVYNPMHGDSIMSGTYEPQTATPRSQIQELHPGGRYYPEQSPPPGSDAMMSGAVEPRNGISASDFDRFDESANLANRYQRPTVEDVETTA